MAKNLKLNIKNAQLAEALNLGKFKKKEDFSSSKALPQEEKPSDQESKAATAIAIPHADEVESHRESFTQPEAAHAHEDMVPQQPKKKEPIQESTSPTRAKPARDMDESEEMESPQPTSHEAKTEASPFPKGYGPKFPPSSPPAERQQPPRHDDSRHEQTRPPQSQYRENAPYRSSNQGSGAPYGSPRPPSSGPRPGGYPSSSRPQDRPYDNRPRQDSRPDSRTDNRGDNRGDT